MIREGINISMKSGIQDSNSNLSDIIAGMQPSDVKPIDYTQFADPRRPANYNSFSSDIEKLIPEDEKEAEGEEGSETKK